MRLIQLNKRFGNNRPLTFIKVSDDDYDELNKYSWSKRVSCSKVYAVSFINGKHVYMHRFILGLTDKNIYVDHKDHDGLNNQRENLRISNSSTNQKNKRPYGSSKYLGVNWHITKWRAAINNNGKQIYIGVYDNEIEAAKAYDKFAKKYHGEFANLNFK